MDYEKKYKEALERAKQVKHDVINIGCKMDPDMLDIIFPELAESEDERIRKEIISALEFANDGGVYDKHIAYLEKQKEQKPVQSDDEREYVRTLKSLISDFLRGKDHIDRGYYQKIYDWLDGRHLEGMGFINKEGQLMIGN